MEGLATIEPISRVESTRVQEQSQINFRGHIAELDGLRAVGLSLVLIDHFWPEGLSILVFQLGNLGWIAMDSFFVMSGFLITGILIDSRSKPNYYSTYYIRRALRIFPLYYVVLALWVCIARYTDYGIDYRNMIHNWGSPLWFAFYAGNIREAAVGFPPKILGFAPLWSLQVEEQFYLLFPLAVALLRRDHLKKLLIAAVFLSPLLRVLGYLWQPNNPFLQYVQLPCHCEGLALGALIAIRFRSGSWNISKPTLTFWTGLLLLGTSVGSVLSTWGTHNQAWGSQWDRLIGYSTSSAGCACLILWLVCFRGSSYTKWLRAAPLQYLGRISYGVYMLHPLALWITIELGKKRFIHFHKDDPKYFLVAVVLSLTFAALSWKFFESPLLKVKDRVSHYRGKLTPTRVPV